MLRGVQVEQFAVAARAAIFGLFALLLGSCSVLDKGLNLTDVDDASESVAAADLTARNPAPLDNRLRDPAAPRGEIYSGSSAGEDGGNLANILNPPPAAPGEEAVARGSDSYDLNFQNADINAVTKVLLGDILKLTYSIDPRVQGTLSLSSGRPVPKSAIMTLYESAVKIVNANLVREGGVYKVVPIGEALGNGEVDTARLTPGYGITILPLRHVSAKTVLQALDSFATKPGMVRVDTARNVLLVQGPSTERASAIETAMALDVDWMKNQSVGVFPVRNASPDTIITELREVFDSGKEGAAGGLVKFQPINRLNAVLAIAQTDGLIRQVRTWVGRLDRADYDNTSVRVYKLRYGNAKIIAAILKDVFTGQSGTLSSVGNADLSQLTPGSTMQRGTSPGTSTGTGTGSGTGLSTATPSLFGNRDNMNGDQSGRSTSSQTGDQRRSTTDIAGLSTSLGGQGGQAPFPNVRITPDIVNNSLLIYASRDQYKMVERAIFELDKAPMQVAIDVTVAEISLKNELQYGVQYYLRGHHGKNTVAFGLADALPLKGVPGAANLVLGKGSDPAVVLTALKAITDVKVLSAPALVVLDNQPAVLQVGDEVPIITRQATDTTVNPGLAPIVNSVDRRNTGVILKVTPRINANGVVNLDVSQEVSNVAGTVDPTLGPTISQRLLQSSIAVTSGQTVLLGGLISSKSTVDRNGIPILMDIKGIGDLFAQNDKKVDRTELIIFIRPQIIRNGIDAQLVGEELRSKLSTLGRTMRAPGQPGPSSRDAR